MNFQYSFSEENRLLHFEATPLMPQAVDADMQKEIGNMKKQEKTQEELKQQKTDFKEFISVAAKIMLDDMKHTAPAMNVFNHERESLRKDRSDAALTEFIAKKLVLTIDPNKKPTVTQREDSVTAITVTLTSSDGKCLGAMHIDRSKEIVTFEK
jgi:arginyl-tRNA synthetase